MGGLFFKLYHAGMSNCRMSLDIGVGLAHLTGRTLVPYGVRAPWSSHPLLGTQKDTTHCATVLDLFQLPVGVDYGHQRVTEIDEEHANRPWTGGVYDSALIIDEELCPDSEDFVAFRNRRHFVWYLSHAPSDDENMLVDNETLGFYSHFFYGAPEKLAELRELLRRIRPETPYRELAMRIAKSLAPFNAVHIRRGDFLYSGISLRANRVTGGEVTKNLASRFSRNDRLVVCTDVSSADWFAPLLKYFRHVVFLDQLLLHDPWAAEFRALPFHDDTVLALITQLVAEEAQCFVGTPFSSFTSLIQRARGFRKKQSKFLYCYSDWDPQHVPFKRCEFPEVQDGPYSWNRTLYPVMPGVYSWFREWPECFQSAAVGNGGTVAPAGTVTLEAREAEVHGVEARYEQTYLLDNIGYWTNPDDYVSWEFTIESEQRYMVAIRYACPRNCAGGTFLVELSGGESVCGTTVSTGDWTIFSSWQWLGKINLSEGQHQLNVRILSMPGEAAMNLIGIRLTPVSE
jgi:hypothetical protein